MYNYLSEYIYLVFGSENLNIGIKLLFNIL